MADNRIIEIEPYLINTREELLLVLQELQEETVKLVKRLRVTLDSIPARIGEKLSKAAKAVTELLDSAFRVDSLEDYEQAASLYGRELAGSLYLLQAEFTRLKAAIIGAAAPIAQVLLPAARTVVEVLTGLANTVGYLLRSLLLGSDSAESFSTALTGVSTAAKTAGRTLAGFDQLNRLGKKTASAGGIFSVSALKPVSGYWKELSEQILALLQPLRQIDLTPAAQSLQKLYTALQPITRELFSGLEWAWYNLFVPLAQWTVEKLLPVFLETLTAALQALGRIIEELKPVFTWLWENCLQPLAHWAGGKVIEYLRGITQELTGVSGWIGENQGPVDRIIQAGKELLGNIGQLAMTTMGWSRVTDQVSGSISNFLLSLTGIGQPLSSTSTAMGAVANAVLRLAQTFGLVDSASGSTWEGLKQVWEGAWTWLKEKTVDPAFRGVKDTVNGVIALINGLLRGVTAGLNYLTKSMNQIGFKLPDWLPVLGGKSFSFSLHQFTAPQIPYLARGAVLPANRPFMAVVGDQKHGTNIEAPLATIQEAVAVVMEDMIASNLAGHEATVSVLREILQAVLGIRIGDDVIASAVERHNRKMAVVWGGY